jgi:uncharacterized protein YciI
MARFAVLCTVDPTQLEIFARLRAEHYRFLIDRRETILLGGPTRTTEGGLPETMIMIIETESLAAAKDFISDEPYNHAGGFTQVVVRPWTQVIPELEDGALYKTLAAEPTGLF